MSLWRPRSVLQLVLVGFVTAVAPLCLAILFTVQTLEDLAADTRNVTREVVSVTRLGQAIQNELLQLERHTRQYLTLFDPDLAKLAAEERNQLLTQLGELRQRISNNGTDATALVELLQQIDPGSPATAGDVSDTVAPTTETDQIFSLIGDHRRGLQRWLQAWVDSLLENNAAQAEGVINALFLQLTFLALATLALLLLLTYRVNKPVQEISDEIHRLGTTGLGHTIRISGPQELAELGEKLEWLRQRLQDIDQQKQQFQRHISHELKTPLASLREGTDLLAEQITGHLSHQQQEVVDIVRRNAIELQRLIENLVDYNQLPRQELVFEEIDLAELWAEILANYRFAIDHKALQLHSHVGHSTWVADRHKLKTTLDNLLSNAVNYTPEGGRIDVVWRREDANLLIEIANSGDAIPAADQLRVFEPFFQSTAKRTGPIKGSGVGLSVARECIESQGGRLDIVPHQSFPVCFRLLCPAH